VLVATDGIKDVRVRPPMARLQPKGEKRV